MNPSQFDWSHWRSFLAILREGSLSGAARSLGAAQPTMRRHLDELEAGLGSSLFVRSPTGLVATDLALSLREAAQTMESAAALLVRTATASAGSVAGTVRITASDVIGVEVLPPILSALKARHRGLSFELALTDSLVDLLRHDADIAVRMIRPTQGDLVARKIGVIALDLYAHDSWIERNGMPYSLAALIASGGMIGYDRDRAIIQAIAAMGARAAPTDFAFRADSNLAQLAALRAGLGVGLCQRPTARRDPALRQVLPAISRDLETWLVTHPNLRGTPGVRATFDGLAEGLRHYIASASETP
jgi:DNA-binding transcriptional LysR family regulator